MPNRILFPDVLRILATLSVIGIHVCALQWYDGLGKFDWEVINFYECLFRWSVPVFVMISGMFFLDPSVNITFEKIFLKSIARILLALLFWGIAYGIYVFHQEVFSGQWHQMIMGCVKILGKIVLGPPRYHLWFLYMIIGLYMLTPILRIYIKNASEKDIVYFLSIFVMFGLGVRLLNEFLKFKIILTLPELSTYVGYFVAGYYFSKVEISNRIRSFFYLIGIVSICISIGATSYLSHLQGKPYEFFYQYLLPTTFFPSVAVFLFVKNICESISLPEKKMRLISYLSELSFGVFLVHDFFIIIYDKVIGEGRYNVFLEVPTATILIFTLSATLIFFVRKIPFIGKKIM